jgi:CopG family nickel-responsive transcriptional regulator
VVSTTHAHLDHDHCIETVILRGRTDAVQAFADAVIAQPGVVHGQLHLVPMTVRHAHGHDHLEPSTATPARRQRHG